MSKLLEVYRRRFHEKTAWEAGCLKWQGTQNAGGSGTMRIAGRRFAATKVAWAIAAQIHPEDLHVSFKHMCDNTLCVAPKHMYIASHTFEVIANAVGVVGYCQQCTREVLRWRVIVMVLSQEQGTIVLCPECWNKDPHTSPGTVVYDGRYVNVKQSGISHQ